MVDLKEVIVIYLIGGFTFIPILLLVIYFLSASPTTPLVEKEKEAKQAQAHQEKKGWIRLTKRYKPKGLSESNVAVLMSGIQSYVQGAKRQKEHVYAELKCGALFIYESDQANEECKIIIPVHNYTVSIYPEKSQDNDIFSKPIALKLTPKKTLEDGDNMEVLLKSTDATLPYLTSNNELFITCARPIDKEDWYFGLLAATEMMSESPNHVEMMDMTCFDASAMQTLISTVQQDADYREVQWLNAIIGRLFLALYKTNEMREFIQEKITKKTEKVKRPGFLGEIVIQSVDMGDSIPYVTQPKLLSLTPEGDLMAEATVNYAGGLRVVIQTDFNWTYSSLMKPIRVPLVLSVTLKKLSGKFMVKVKPPPTNRCWFGFYEVPDMEWAITPIVSDKQIRLSMVTNAIQAKIREFMMENVVLPNMDDFPFCPSNGKGGIFGERVPKPSSPKETTLSNTAINLDLLGNKVNHKPSPKVVVSSTSPVLPRRETIHSFDTGLLASEKTTVDRRTKSISPTTSDDLMSLPVRSRRDSNPEPVVEQKAGEETSLEEETSEDMPTPSFTRRLSYNLAGFRKRNQPLESLKEDHFTIEAEPVYPLDTTTQEPEVIEETIPVEITEEKIKEQYTTTTVVAEPVLPLIQPSLSTNTKMNLLSKTISNRITTTTTNIKIASKKNALYNMAGNMFNKKVNKVSKEMKDERTRELQESHNRKMMNLFINNEPPPLPPRRQPVSAALSLSSLSSEEDEEASSPVTEKPMTEIKQQVEEVIIVEQHGLTLLEQ